MKINITKLKFTLTILGIYIPPLLLFTLILKFSVNVPHWEEWDYLVPLFIDFYKNHYLNMEYVFDKTGENYIFIPKLFLAIVGLITNADFKIMQLSNYLVLFLTWCLIIFQIKKDHVKNKNYLIAVSSISIFSLAPAGVYLWAFSSYLFFSNFFALSIFLVLSNENIKINKIIIIIILSLCSCLSHTYGLSVIAVIFFISIYLYVKTKNKLYLMLFTFTFVEFFLCIFFMKNFNNMSNLISFFDIHNIKNIIFFNIIYFGSNTIEVEGWKRSYTSLGIGVFFIFLFNKIIIEYFLNLKRKIYPLRLELFFIMIGMYAMLCAFLTSLGRSSDGPFMALLDRYRIVSILLPLSISSLLIIKKLSFKDGNGSLNKLNLNKKSNFIFLDYIIILLTLFFLLNSFNINNINEFIENHTSRLNAKNALLNYNNLNVIYYENLSAICPKSDTKIKIFSSHSYCDDVKILDIEKLKILYFFNSP